MRRIKAVVLMQRFCKGWLVYKSMGNDIRLKKLARNFEYFDKVKTKLETEAVALIGEQYCLYLERKKAKQILQELRRQRDARIKMEQELK
jgi:hypothetical protein